ncbi:MAG: single-stranded-DNA-specific exonuclease RecJ, partial [Treponema sp.]|nr:single-stranded-DNA-specific exonuclease RecJ [Treponema sp.]
HNPFLFKNMEDAVDRILDAKEEGEKILIFGDRDVDGVTATSILYNYLESNGYDVSWRIPIGEESYGLSMNAVEEFAKNYGTLIITVDCGISNVQEVAFANELGIDVIVTDHHNPPEILPDAYTIIDPKTSDSGYPFQDISGAVVSMKLVKALRYSSTDLYKEEVTLFDAQKTALGFSIECIKTRNLIIKDKLKIDIPESGTSITQTPLPEFLKGQQIICWEKEKVENILKEIFGSAVEFNLFDFKNACKAFFPSLVSSSLNQLNAKSRLAKYNKNENALESFYNLFVTYMEKKIENESNTKSFQEDIQLATLATIADCMPLKNENRIIVKEGVRLFNEGKVRAGIAELFSLLSIGTKKISSSDLSWNVIPSLNSAGRIGEANTSVSLLVSKEPSEREKLSKVIIEMNEKRKDFVKDAFAIMGNQAEESFFAHNQKLCVVIDKRINKGVTGIVAARLMAQFGVPAIVATCSEEKIVAGSMRSCKGLNATEFLENFAQLFINYGGHNKAAGFSFENIHLDAFKENVKKCSEKIALEEDSETVFVDAELPHNYLSEKILETVDAFEPFGEENKELVFYSHALPVCSANVVGKTDVTHLKILFDCGKCKFPAMFWKEGERLGKEFNVGDKLDAIFSVTRNTFNGTVTPQMILTDIQKV